MNNCKYCGTKVNDSNSGYLSYLDDSEQTRLNELKLKRNESVCIECKQELMFASLIAVI